MLRNWVFESRCLSRRAALELHIRDERSIQNRNVLDHRIMIGLESCSTVCVLDRIAKPISQI
jgi:hypothetical protein